MTKVKVTEEQIAENMQDVIVRTEIEFGKPVTYVTIRMKNGFTLREFTANYDEETGKKICLGKLKSRVRQLLSYTL